jgi:hypothetical protein
MAQAVRYAAAMRSGLCERIDAGRERREVLDVLPALDRFSGTLNGGFSGATIEQTLDAYNNGLLCAPHRK